jgi:hypothetical protein
MRLAEMMKTGSLGALAAAMAMAALPDDALARGDNDRGGWSHGSNSSGSRSASSSSSNRSSGSSWHSSSSQSRSAPAPTPAPRQNYQQQRQPSQARAPQRSYTPPQGQSRNAQAYQGNQHQDRNGQAYNGNSRQDRQQSNWTSRRPSQTYPANTGQHSAPSSNASNAYANRDSGYRSGSNTSRTDQNYDGSGYYQKRFADRDGDSGNWRRGDSNGYNHDRDHDGDHDRWDRNWRNDHRYDWHDYRNRHRSIFHLGFYYAPYSYWSYRPLSIGFYLDSLFYSSRYWIDDPWRYRLPEVYGPYRWVRYYDDALLVNVYTGEVVDVIHDFFW